jgi:arylsulfatase
VGIRSAVRQPTIRRENTSGAVDLAYEDRSPYAFTGTVKKVAFDLKPGTASEEKTLHEYHSTQTVLAGIAG